MAVLDRVWRLEVVGAGMWMEEWVSFVLYIGWDTGGRLHRGIELGLVFCLEFGSWQCRAIMAIGRGFRTTS